MDDDLEWFRSELALAQWNLDAAASASTAVAREHLQRAHQIYRELLRMLPDVSLHEERQAIERGLEEIKVRLQIDGPEI